jgi:hypothetical protein
MDVEHSDGDGEARTDSNKDDDILLFLNQKKKINK